MGTGDSEADWHGSDCARALCTEAVRDAQRDVGIARQTPDEVTNGSAKPLDDDWPMAIGERGLERLESARTQTAASDIAGWGLADALSCKLALRLLLRPETTLGLQWYGSVSE